MLSSHVTNDNTHTMRIAAALDIQVCLHYTWVLVIYIFQCNLRQSMSKGPADWAAGPAHMLGDLASIEHAHPNMRSPPQEKHVGHMSLHAKELMVFGSNLP